MVELGGRYLIRSIASHTRRKDHTPLNTLLDKRLCRRTRSKEGPVQIHAKQRVNLLFGKIQRGLVMCTAGVHDHSMESACFGNYGINCGNDSFFFGYVGGYGVQLSRKAIG
jgi:hypothetical protein